MKQVSGLAITSYTVKLEEEETRRNFMARAAWKSSITGGLKILFRILTFKTTELSRALGS